MPGAPAGPADGAAPPIGPAVDPQSLVYNIDIFLLIAILTIASFNAPRAIARFANRSEWFQGLFLHTVAPTRTPHIDLNPKSISPFADPKKSVLDLDDGNAEVMHPQSVSYPPSRSTHDEKARSPFPWTVVATSAPAQLTWHMPMLSSLHPIATLLHIRVHEHYSLGQALLMAVYAAVMVYAGLYRSSPFSEFNRSSWIAVSQLPLIYILATKNNVIGMVVGVGYEKLNYLHRFAGMFAVFAVNLHAIGYLYKWSIAGTISDRISMPFVIHGLLALACFDILGFFSIKFMRARFYHLFYVTHVVGSIILLFAIPYHAPRTLPYLIAASVFYALDHVVRAIKTRVTTATLRPISELGLTRVEMPTINAGWRAGQHVRLRVLSTSMGLWGMTEVHPFTIASVSKSEEGLVLLCKKTGRWTTKMYELGSGPTYGEQGREVGTSVKVMVEGPYGGLGHTVVSSYSGAMFIAGGSGVTFVLTALQDLVRMGDSSNVTDIDVVWCIADPASLTPMLSRFATLVSECPTTRLHISVFYTRAPARSFEGVYLPPAITLVPGRPNIARHLGALVSATLTGGGCSGVFVGVCGPVSLAASVRKSVRRFDRGVKRAVGGVECHEEAFGF